jgi:hypothetical protein
MNERSRNWTNDEIRALKKLFRSNSTSFVADTLGRTIKSIERKAARLGLKKTKKYLKSLGR